MIGLLKKPLSIWLLEIQNALPVIRRVKVGSVRFRLFGISLNTAKMKYVI